MTPEQIKFQEELIYILIWCDEYPEDQVNQAAKSLAFLNIEQAPFELSSGYGRKMLIKGTQIDIHEGDAEHVCGLMNKALEVSHG